MEGTCSFLYLCQDGLVASTNHRGDSVCPCTFKVHIPSNIISLEFSQFAILSLRPTHPFQLICDISDQAIVLATEKECTLSWHLLSLGNRQKSLIALSLGISAIIYLRIAGDLGRYSVWGWGDNLVHYPLLPVHAGYQPYSRDTVWWSCCGGRYLFGDV